jgi:hypothetical protein
MSSEKKAMPSPSPSPSEQTRSNDEARTKSLPITVYQPPNDPVEAQAELLALDRLDEKQIVASLKGRAIDKLFHEIDVRGQKQIALSWAGVKYFSLEAGHISVEKVELSETQDSYRATAWAYDKVRDVRIMGAAEQSKSLRQKDGTRSTDEFALAKAVSKGQRNALRNLIPETMIAEAYRIWKSQQTPSSQKGADPTETFQRLEVNEPLGDPKSQKTWEPWVPVSIELLDKPGLKQIPLVDGTTTIGMINALADGTEVSLVPSKPVPTDSRPIQGFLISKILEAIKTKHPEVEYHLETNGPMLLYVVVRGSLDDSQIKELANAAKWAFSKASQS